MFQRWVSLVIAGTLLSAVVLSVDADGGAYEGKGIEEVVVYSAPCADAQRPAASASRLEETIAHIVSLSSCDGKTYFAFECLFLTVAQNRWAGCLPALMPHSPLAPIVASRERSARRAETRGPPRSPLILPPSGLRAPPCS